MGSEQETSGSLSPELAVVLDAQKNAILIAVNAQIQGLQTNLLQAQSDLAVQIASALQPDTYVFKKKGNEGDANEFHFAGDPGCKICSFILAWSDVGINR